MRGFFFGNLSATVVLFLMLISIGIPVCSGASGSWYIQTVDEGRVGNGTSLALDSDSYAHISYIDFGNGSLKYARQDESGWHATTVDTHVVGWTKTSLALDSEGNPHISYYDSRTGALKFAELESLQWQITTVDNSDIDIHGTGNSTSLALDRAGNPHISYTDYKTGALKYATRNAMRWSTGVVDPEGGVLSSIVLDTKGSPHIAYTDFRKRFLKYAYKTGSTWSLITVDPHGGDESSLALDSRDKPHITYVNFTNWMLNYAWQDESGWHYQIIDTDDSSGWDSSIRLDKNDKPLVVYRREAFCFSVSDCEEGGLRLAVQDAEGWNITTVDRWGGYAASLALDRRGNPHISYFYLIGGVVKYVRARVPTDPQPTAVAITPVPTPSISTRPTKTTQAQDPETDRFVSGFFVFTGLVAVFFCIFYIISSRFYKSMEKTSYAKKDLNVLLFPDETKIFFVLVLFLSFAGILRMLLFFPDLFSEFSRSALKTYIYIGRDVSLLILVPFILLAFLIYLLRPWYLIRKEHMVRLVEKEPAIAEKISALAGSQKPATAVTAMFSPDSGVGIYTFGAHRHHYIVMNRGFIDVFLNHDDEMRAILSHELAHVRSGDVKRTELALAFLASFFCCAVIFLGMGISLIIINFLRYGENLGAVLSEPGVNGGRPYGFNPVMQNFITNFTTAIVVVLIVGISIWFLTRFIIRYRELYADWMATQMMGESVSLVRALTRMQAVALFRGKRHSFISLPRFPVFPRYHPAITDREEFIGDPGKFFSMGLAMPFIIGFAVAWFFQMMAVFLTMFTIPLGPDTMLVSVSIPGVILAAALLLPRLTSQVILPDKTRSWHSNPVVVSQVLMLGYASSSYIMTNLGQLLDLIIHNVLRIGTPGGYSSSYVFLGTEFPPYHPAMAFIGGEVMAICVLGILLISTVISLLLVQFTAMKWVANRPVLMFLLVPGFFAAAVVSLVLCNFIVPGLVLLFSGLLVLIIARQKFHKCPVCASPLPGGFDPGIPCPACGFDVGWWIKNAK